MSDGMTDDRGQDDRTWRGTPGEIAAHLMQKAERAGRRSKITMEDVSPGLNDSIVIDVTVAQPVPAIAKSTDRQLIEFLQAQNKNLTDQNTWLLDQVLRLQDQLRDSRIGSLG